MKLLYAGLVLLGAAIAIILFTDLDPATPFIGGTVCTLIGVIDLIARPDSRPAASAGDPSEANYLANLQNYGSADRSARYIDGT